MKRLLRAVCLVLCWTLLMAGMPGRASAEEAAPMVRVLLRRLQLTDRADLTLAGAYTVRVGGEDLMALPENAQVTALIAPCYVLFTLVEVLSATMRGVGDAVVPAAITMVFTCIVRLIYLWGYAFSHNSNLTIAVIYPISWVLTSIAFLLYYKSRKWMPKGFHF